MVHVAISTPPRPRFAGKPFDLAALKGKVVLITNVASACGYTDRNYK